MNTIKVHLNSRNFFLLSAALFIGSLIFHLGFGEYFHSSEYHEKKIADNLTREVVEQEESMIDVLDSLSVLNLVSFSEFPLNKEYPWFVFRNGRILLWSDYHFVPDYYLVEGEYVYRTIQFDRSIYVVRKWTVKNGFNNFEVFTLIPIYQSYRLQNQYLDEVYNPEIFKNNDVSISLSEESGFYPIYLQGNLLISVTVGDRYSYGTELYNSLVGIGYGLAFLALAIALFLQYQSLEGSNRIRFGFIAILSYWGVLKLIMFAFDFPNSLISFDFFDAQYFAVSWFERSFADMLINTFLITIFSVYVFANFRQFRFIQYLSSDRCSPFVKLLAGAILMLLTIIAINYQYLQIKTIYFNSQISFDVTNSLMIDKFRAFSFLVFVLVSISTSLFLHVSQRIFKMLFDSNLRFLLAVAVGSLLFLLLTHFSFLNTGNLLLLTIAVVLVLHYSNLPSALVRNNYRSAIYMLSLIVLNAGIATWCITEFEKERELIRMRKFANELIEDSDNLAEFLIYEASDDIANDPFIATRMANPFLSKETVVKKIRRNYINSYLNKYGIDIWLYNANGDGIPVFGSEVGYNEIVDRYVNDANATDYKGLYHVARNTSLERNRYVSFIPVSRYEKVVGYIILDFRQQKLVPQQAFPELLTDNRFAVNSETRFEYAIYAQSSLIQKLGEFPYPERLKTSNLPDGWYESGYLHLAVTNAEDEVAVVSIEANYWDQLISNFSFLLVVLLVPLAVVYIVLAFRNYFQQRELSYTAKIQIYLNLAFFIPLLLVTVTTLSMITSSYRTALIESKLRESRSLAAKMAVTLDEYLIGSVNEDELTERLNNLVSYGTVDANIYDVSGRLISTTQPEVFSAALISTYLNPQVISEVVESGNYRSLKTENIGTLEYYSTYSAIRSNETDRLLGVVGIPFFQSESTLEQSRIEALTTIINLFVLIFLAALVATYLTSRWLTYPLTLLRQKLEHVSFAQQNDPLRWDSDDEIGLLVDEYNNMLVKLEESKEALARSQKESAWREVAQQVAHEIKNPLTPMKLTLQKLQRNLGDVEGDSEKVKESLRNLLAQLNTLNDIVTSFSDFAKMPIPKSEQVNLNEVIREGVDLFESDSGLNISLDFHEDNIVILSDRKLMGRIISNILINASQSRKNGQEVVNLKVKTEAVHNDNVVRLSFSDDGRGIPEEIKEKVFMPKFSTKSEGSGIGLAVAKHGVEHGGGSIYVESEEGQGTTFVIEFPRLHG